MHPGVDRVISSVWRRESARIVASLARLVRDIGLAEELAQDALVSALEHWPASGIPDNPGAWLMATAKNGAFDRLRRDKLLQQKLQEIGLDLEAQQALVVPDFVDGLDAARNDVIGDDVLRLMFTACHPVLSTEARIALTLKTVAGLTTQEIARAFLVPEPTLAQRLVRAKRTLREAAVPFELPPPEALPERIDSVLQAVYLIFNEGYTATSGTDWLRPALCDEALRLGRLLARLAPRQPEVHGLVALMELQASRTKARTDGDGRPVLLLDQDRSRWDIPLIGRGLDSLALAESLGGPGGPAGPYRLQAAIAACHARARTAQQTDWEAIIGLYEELARVAHSPVVELNRAVAVGMARGPLEALAIVDEISRDRALQEYQWLPGVRGDLLEKLGRHDEARKEFERAAALAGNARERDLMLERANKNRAGL
ncbi:MAG TPA: RNA polymerase sigma factor [Telluria sp.]